MQNATQAYKTSMKQPFRNVGYVKGSIGIINSEAQSNASIDTSKTELFPCSQAKYIYSGGNASQVYAFPEQGFSKVDGSMFFSQESESGWTNSDVIGNQGVISQDLLGSVYFNLNGTYDIKGLTIDFGDCYPETLTIETNKGTNTYTGASKFVTETTFDEVTYFKITPTAMINGQGRMRIYSISFGITDSFTSKEVISCSVKDYVSATTETLPSKDVEIVLDNQDSYYNPDNEESAIGYLELGQEVHLSFGYDVQGDGDIEWLPETLTYLKNWDASDTQVQFTCTDLFESMTGTYYNGTMASGAGVSLYDLAVDVFADANISTSSYYIDPYLKKIYTNNAVPAVKHSEALQIIANAGRCALFDDREGRIHIQSSFIPDAVLLSNGEEMYSNSFLLMNSQNKTSYAESSQGFTLADGSQLWLPDNTSDYLLTNGYASLFIADENGTFETIPLIQITLESGYIANGLEINFRNVFPQEIVVDTYNDDVLVESRTFQPTSTSFVTSETFSLFNKMIIKFTKGSPNSKIFIDSITLGDVTDYHITRNDLTSTPVASRADKLSSMTVFTTQYSEDGTTTKDLATDEVTVSSTNLTHTFYLKSPSFNFSVSVESPESKGSTNVTASITGNSSYYVTVQFDNVTAEETVKVKLSGNEYAKTETSYQKKYNENGKDYEWTNPLIDKTSLAKDLEEWLSSYYLGMVEYQLDWRGDPRTDANDLFYLMLKDGRERIIRAYENDISFDGTWSGKIKARAVVI